jgi:hypothetical protein
MRLAGDAGEEVEAVEGGRLKEAFTVFILFLWSYKHATIDWLLLLALGWVCGNWEGVLEWNEYMGWMISGVEERNMVRLVNNSLFITEDDV